VLEYISIERHLQDKENISKRTCRSVWVDEK
jgi:hypothetical protein